MTLKKFYEKNYIEIERKDFLNLGVFIWDSRLVKWIPAYFDKHTRYVNKCVLYRRFYKGETLVLVEYRDRTKRDEKDYEASFRYWIHPDYEYMLHNIKKGKIMNEKI